MSTNSDHLLRFLMRLLWYDGCLLRELRSHHVFDAIALGYPLRAVTPTIVM